MIPRVLHVTPTLDPAAGGPPVVVRRLAERARANGFCAAVLAAGGTDADVVVPGQRAALLGTGRRAVGDAVAQANLVHLHTLWSPLVAVASAEARRRGIPTLLSPHGMLDPWSLSQKAWKKQLYLAAVERRTLSGATRTLFTTASERDLALKAIGPLPDPAVIALGADEPPQPRERLAAAFRAEHPDLSDRPLLIFLGRLHDKKRPDAAIAAMPKIRAAIPNATLLMVGTGPPHTVATLKADAQRRGLNGAVRFLGHLEGRAKWQALAAARVFVLPSRQENFAIAAAEALHAGVPVILTQAVAIWRDVVEAGAGAVVAQDGLTDGLAHATVRLLVDDDAHGAAANAARTLAARAYSWDASARATHALYANVVGSLHSMTERLCV